MSPSDFMKIYEPTDWLKPYDHYKKTLGVMEAREFIVTLMLRDRGWTRETAPYHELERAQDYLTKLINERVQRDISEENIRAV